MDVKIPEERGLVFYNSNNDTPTLVSVSYYLRKYLIARVEILFREITILHYFSFAVSDLFMSDKLHSLRSGQLLCKTRFSR